MFIYFNTIASKIFSRKQTGELEHKTIRDY